MHAYWRGVASNDLQTLVPTPAIESSSCRLELAEGFEGKLCKLPVAQKPYETNRLPGSLQAQLAVSRKLKRNTFPRQSCC